MADPIGRRTPRTVTYAELVHAVNGAAKRMPGTTTLVAIDGRGGSGKSTLAAMLAEGLDDAVVVHLDDFASPAVDRERVLEQLIQPLRANRAARFQQYDWNTKTLADWRDVEAGGVVIVEGVSALHDLLFTHFEIKVWVECSAQLGFERGLARDVQSYGVDTRKDWLDVWMPAEQTYIDSQRPQQRADFIIDTLTSLSDATGGIE